MKAIVYDKYGPPNVLKLADVPKPEINSGEILVKVRAVAVTVADSRLRGARFPAGFNIIARLIFGITAPRRPILGSSFSGEVVAIGDDMSEFVVGDQVFGMLGLQMGGYAEFVKIGQHQGVIKKPKNLTHTQAAALSFGGTTALFFLQDKAQLTRNQRILINGASGSVGSSAVQIAKAFGAVVAAVCGPQNVKMMNSLGADDVYDYTKVNVREHHNQYDVVMDTVGNLSLDECEQILKPNGKCLLVVAGLPKMLQASFATLRSAKKVTYITGTASESKAGLQFLADHFVQKKLDPVLTKVFPFEKVVDAHQLVDTGHKSGNFVLEI